MNKTYFYDVLQAACTRPKMYTPNGSFFEIVSFLEGLGMADNINKGPFHSFTTPFRMWLKQRLEIESRIDALDWVEFRNAFQSDETATRQLLSLYAEFIESLHSPV